jgi:hypothetical protein
MVDQNIKNTLVRIAVRTIVVLLLLLGLTVMNYARMYYDDDNPVDNMVQFNPNVTNKDKTDLAVELHFMEYTTRSFKTVANETGNIIVIFSEMNDYYDFKEIYLAIGRDCTAFVGVWYTSDFNFDANPLNNQAETNLYQQYVESDETDYVALSDAQVDREVVILCQTDGGYEAITNYEKLIKVGFIQSYFSYLGDILKGDFGQSFMTREKVSTEIGTYLPLTLYFQYIGFFAFYLISIVLLAIAIVPLSKREEDTGAWKQFGYKLLVYSSFVFWIGFAVQVFMFKFANMGEAEFDDHIPYLTLGVGGVLFAAIAIFMKIKYLQKEPMKKDNTETSLLIQLLKEIIVISLVFYIIFNCFEFLYDDIEIINWKYDSPYSTGDVGLGIIIGGVLVFLFLGIYPLLKFLHEKDRFTIPDRIKTRYISLSTHPRFGSYIRGIFNEQVFANIALAILMALSSLILTLFMVHGLTTFVYETWFENLMHYEVEAYRHTPLLIGIALLTIGLLIFMKYLHIFDNIEIHRFAFLTVIFSFLFLLRFEGFGNLIGLRTQYVIGDMRTDHPLLMGIYWFVGVVLLGSKYIFDVLKDIYELVASR